MQPVGSSPAAVAPAGGLFLRLRRSAFGPAGVYFAATALAKAGSILLIPLYTRKLSVEDYGNFALAQTLVQILPTVLSLGLIAAVARFFFEGTDRARAIERTAGIAWGMALISIGFATVLQAGLLILVPPDRTGLFARHELTCILWAGVGGCLGAIPATYLRSAQRPFAAAAFQLAQFATGLTSGIVLVAVMGRGLGGCIEAVALASTVDGLAGLTFIAVALRGKLTRALLLEGLRFSLPFVPHFLANQLQYIGDRWVLKGAGLEAQLGSYSLASQLAAPQSMAIIAWNDSAGARAGELFRVEGLAGLRRDFRLLVRGYLQAAAIPAALIVAALPVAAYVVGSKFGSALWFVPVLCLIITIEAVYFPSNLVVFYAKKTHLIPIITISAAVLNLGLNLVLVRFAGVIGAIAARAISMSFRSGVMWVTARRCLPSGDPP